MQFSNILDGTIRVEKTTGADSDKFDKQLNLFGGGNARVLPAFSDMFFYRFVSKLNQMEFDPTNVSNLLIGVGDGSKTNFTGLDVSNYAPINVGTATINWTSNGMSKSVSAYDSIDVGDFSQKTEFNSGKIREDGIWEESLTFASDTPDDGTPITLEFDRGLNEVDLGFYFDLAQDSSPTTNVKDYTSKVNLYDNAGVVPTTTIDWYQTPDQYVLSTKMSVTFTPNGTNYGPITGFGFYCSSVNMTTNNPENQILAKSNILNNTGLFGDSGLNLLNGQTYNISVEILLRTNK